MNLFVDTNFFIQCKTITELDWNLVTDSKVISLFVSKPVVSEIDRFKHDMNKRRQHKARMANSIFREILDSGNSCICKKTHDKEIFFIVDCNPTPAELQEKANILDLNKPDDAIVASVLIHRGKYPDADAHLLTYDTGQMLTARSVGVPYKSIPRKWIMPPENDTRQKEINQLRKKLEEYTRREPKIIAELSVNSVEYADDAILNISQNLSLSKNEREDLKEMISTKFPQATFPDEEIGNNDASESDESDHQRTCTLISRLKRPSEEKIREYNNLYSDWIVSVDDFFSNYPDVKSTQSRVVPFSVIMENIGSVPLEGVVLKIKVLHGGLLCLRNYHGCGNGMFLGDIPKPPEVPKSLPQVFIESGIMDAIEAGDRLRSIIEGYKIPDLTTGIFRGTDIPTVYIPRPNEFVWMDERPIDPVREFVLQCEEFRHKEGRMEFSYHFKVALPIPDRIVIEVFITARNLMEPYRKVFPVACMENSGNVIKELMEIVDGV